MSDDTSTRYRQGCATHAVGAVLMSAAIGCAFWALDCHRYEIASALIIAASICFAAIAISEGLRSRS